MREMRKLEAAAIDCPICGEGKAALFEEDNVGTVQEPKEGGPLEVSYPVRFRQCDHCQTEFAGQVESRYNLEQHKAALAKHGPLKFPPEKAA